MSIRRLTTFLVCLLLATNVMAVKHPMIDSLNNVVVTKSLKVTGPSAFTGAVTFAGAESFTGNLTLQNLAVIKNDTNNIVRIYENSEDLRILFANNRITVNSSTGAILDFPVCGDITADRATLDTLGFGIGSASITNLAGTLLFTEDTSRTTGLLHVGDDIYVAGNDIRFGNGALISDDGDTLWIQESILKNVGTTWLKGSLLVGNGFASLADLVNNLTITEESLTVAAKLFQNLDAKFWGDVGITAAKTLTDSGTVNALGNGQIGDSFGDTWNMYGWLDWGWREIDPATHGELVRCAAKTITGCTGSQFQAGFFAMQNKFSTPATYVLGGLEGKATASAPTQYIRGVRAGVVCKDSGTVDMAMGLNAYNECLSGATADTMVKILTSDIAWAGTVTTDIGIMQRTLNTIDCGIYHGGTFTKDFQSSDGSFNCDLIIATGATIGASGTALAYVTEYGGDSLVIATATHHWKWTTHE